MLTTDNKAKKPFILRLCETDNQNHTHTHTHDTLEAIILPFFFFFDKVFA